MISPLDNMTHPGHLGKPAPEAGGGAVCSRAPLPSNLPALPWSDLAVPGPCERSARPNTTGYVGPPISSRPRAATPLRSGQMRCLGTVSHLACSLLCRSLAAAVGVEKDMAPAAQFLIRGRARHAQCCSTSC